MSEATALLRLQEIDLELMRSKKVAQDLPQRAKVEAARAAVKKVMGELTKIVGQRKDIEIELQDHEEDKVYYADKVTEIQESVSNGTYRDAQNFEAALATLAKRIEKAEFDSNALVGQLETVERAEKNARDDASSPIPHGTHECLYGRARASATVVTATLAQQAPAYDKVHSSLMRPG